MAKSGSLFLITLLFISVSLSTSTRILPGEFLPDINGVIFSGEIPPDSKIGCGGEETKTEYSFIQEIVTGKFGSLVLNALPKGNRPASGPSKKIHDVKT